MTFYHKSFVIFAYQSCSDLLSCQFSLLLSHSTVIASQDGFQLLNSLLLCMGLPDYSHATEETSMPPGIQCKPIGTRHTETQCIWYENNIVKSNTQKHSVGRWTFGGTRASIRTPYSAGHLQWCTSSILYFFCTQYTWCDNNYTTVQDEIENIGLWTFSGARAKIRTLPCTPVQSDKLFKTKNSQLSYCCT